MAGHSKWANIKRQKARVDAVKGQTFTKISRAIIVAARNGVADLDGNFQLRSAVEKAKAAGIPNENIERAIAKGVGKFSDGNALEAIRYEGYGPGGVAILVEALTDNRNRTAADLRVALTKNGGNLGETGCVGWLFQQRGVILLACAQVSRRSPQGAMLASLLEEDVLLELCLEIGADAYEWTEFEDAAAVELITAPEQLEPLTQHLKALGYGVAQAELRWIPQNTVVVDNPDQARALWKLMDALENLDDVQSVAANFELTEAILALA
ncbi:transcriptional regulator [Neosynechococcus sphagnicola sy1]|uniref:Probable transcriptional regulatory protein DO97_03075 n=1 Tax=Neosynechococcus sphagnicola sy1 TaxID=1497020 RepID=A0A098TQC7_9CYAN|nr:YebC/PmpR family DNA-binding transcriptional regulator [Neosynechococcus sphagnicola]KGF73033.1 transcriptional regulator [Neosynechococcus sphagnicola sy1]